jgi:hypothetical protein
MTTERLGAGKVTVMQIGKTLRSYTIEPLVDPVPAQEPTPADRPSELERELVPGGPLGEAPSEPSAEMPVAARRLGL